ncbi:MAG TPA: ABC transporter ATP-binding protein [Candidatus Angelobacter sp.]|nr:ABC transporter ATP-binding protein [Candidatus Angelobacter sp.]
MTLRLSALEVRRKRFHLGPVDLCVPSGTFLSILGESGAGKSTLLQTLAGLITPDAGRIFLDGNDITDVPPEDRPSTFCQQDSLLFPVFRVIDNLAFALVAKGMNRNQARELAAKRAADFRIPRDLLSAWAETVSGGEARRIALGRAFLKEDYRAAYLDEITSNLDGENKRAVAKLTLDLFLESSSIFLFVCHEPALALEMASAAISAGRHGLVAVMKAGKLLEMDAPQEIYLNPKSLYTARLFGDVSVLDLDGRQELSSQIFRAFPSPIENCTVGVRPEDAVFYAAEAPDGAFSVASRLLRTWFVGSVTKVEVETPCGNLIATAARQTNFAPGTTGQISLSRLLFFRAGANR